MTGVLKGLSKAVDLISLRGTIFPAHEEKSRRVLEESDCKLLDASTGG